MVPGRHSPALAVLRSMFSKALVSHCLMRGLIPTGHVGKLRLRDMNPISWGHKASHRQSLAGLPTLSISMVLYFRETVYSCPRSPLKGREEKAGRHRGVQKRNRRTAAGGGGKDSS